MADAARRLATLDDLLALPDDRRAEIVGGLIVDKAAPSAEHGDAQSSLAALLRGPFHRRGGPHGPGGWWILTEVEVRVAPHEVYRPDLVGWRRATMPERPTGRPVEARPDWWCEILSPSNARTDLVDKLRALHAAAVPHYWIVDPERETLTVLRHTPEGYLTALVAARGERVTAEPFDALSLDVGLLFGDDPDGPADPSPG